MTKKSRAEPPSLSQKLESVLTVYGRSGAASSTVETRNCSSPCVARASIAWRSSAGLTRRSRLCGARYGAQEAVAESRARVRALDESGDVGDDERLEVSEVNDAEVRLQSRERVVGHLRPRRRDGRDDS